MVSIEQKKEIIEAVEEGGSLGKVIARLEIAPEDSENFQRDCRKELIEARRCGQISKRINRLEDRMDALREEKAKLKQ